MGARNQSKLTVLKVLHVDCCARLKDAEPPPPGPGRLKADLVLSDEEHAQLTRWARRAKTAQLLAMRARIVPACAQGGTNKQVAAELRAGQSTVNRWRSRFVRDRLQGLLDEPRSGRPPELRIGGQLERVLHVWLEIELAPDPSDGRLRQAGALRHRRTRPVSVLAWQGLQRCHHDIFDLIKQDRGRPRRSSASHIGRPVCWPSG